MDSFRLSSEQCELLVALERAGSIKALAQILTRDESVVSRQIKSISQIAPVLEKSENRWTLTVLGRSVTQWSREAMEEQSYLLSSQTSLRIATTREFSSKVLIPHIHSLIESEKVSLSIITADDGVEKELLSGRADFGIDCGRPDAPLIKFKSVLSEPYVVVASPEFLKRYTVGKKEDLLSAPHLKFRRDPALKLLKLNSEIPNIAATFNDIASVRAACSAGMGWATLPRYTVQSEIKDGLLISLKGWEFAPRSFGIWWIRGRNSSSYWADRAVAWLGRQKI